MLSNLIREPVYEKVVKSGRDLQFQYYKGVSQDVQNDLMISTAGLTDMSIDGSYLDVVSKGYSKYIDDDTISILSSDDIVGAYNAYINLNIDRLKALAEQALANNNTDTNNKEEVMYMSKCAVNSLYSPLDATIVSEIEAILQLELFNETELRKYITDKYFDATDNPDKIRSTLTLRHNWNKRVTGILENMLLTNYSLLGMTKEEAMAKIQDIKSGDIDLRATSVTSVWRSIIHNKDGSVNTNFVHDNIIDLRSIPKPNKKGGNSGKHCGIIYISDEVVADMRSESPSPIVYTAINYAFSYDIVLMAHGIPVNVAKTYFDVYKMRNLTNLLLDGNTDEAMRTFEEYKEFLSEEDYKKYKEELQQVYNNSKYYQSKLTKDEYLNIQYTIDNIDEYNKYVAKGYTTKSYEELVPLVNGNVNNRNIVRRISKDMQDSMKGKWMAQKVKIGNQYTAFVDTQIRAILKEHPEAKSMMVMNCNLILYS